MFDSLLMILTSITHPIITQFSGQSAEYIIGKLVGVVIISCIAGTLDLLILRSVPHKIGAIKWTTHIIIWMIVGGIMTGFPR